MLLIKIVTFSIMFASIISVKCLNSNGKGEKDLVLSNKIESNKRDNEQSKFIYQNYSRVHRNLDNGVIYGDSSNKCGGTFKSVQTTIQSPDYPNEYQPNRYCEYVFKSPFVCKNEFHIQFLFFSLESSKDCLKDHLKIGKHETLCGKVIGIMKYKAMDGVLKITFVTDDNMEGLGFNLLVTRLPCNDEESEPSTIFPFYDKRTIKNDEWDVTDIEFTTSINEESSTANEIDGQSTEATTSVIKKDMTEPTLTLQPPIYDHFSETQNKSYQFSYLGANGNGYLPPSSTDIPTTHTNCFPGHGGQYPSNEGQYPVNGGQFPTNGEQFPTNGGQYPTNEVQYPSNGNQFPGSGNQFPGNGNQFPGNGNQFPGNGNQFPGNGNQFPGNGNQFPGNVNQFPGSGNQFPGSGNQFPGSGNQFPGNGNQFPGNGNQFPGNGNQFPGNGNQFPGNVQYPNGQGQFPTTGYPSTPFYSSTNVFQTHNVPSLYPHSNYPSFNGYLPPRQPANNFPSSNGYLPSSNGYLPQYPNQFPNPPSSYPTFPTNNGYPSTYFPSTQPSSDNDPNVQEISPVKTTPTRDVVQSQMFPTAIPQCCTRQFNQQRFYVASSNFPTKNIQNVDCLHYINRNNPSVCRIRIEFKFFFFGNYHPQLGCVDDFIEIDGQRICGCRNGMRYISQWGIGSKIIRVQSRARVAQGVRGFLFDVIQEQCPYRISRDSSLDGNGTSWDRSDRSVPVLQKAFTQTNSSSLTTYFYYAEDTDTNTEKPKVRLETNAEFDERAEGPNARFFYPPTGQQNRCTFSYLNWLQLVADPLWLVKPTCRR